MVTSFLMHAKYQSMKLENREKSSHPEILVGVLQNRGVARIEGPDT